MKPIQKFVDNMKQSAPKTNWSNIFTGLAILALVAAFSFVYFNRSKTQQEMANEDSVKLEEMIKDAINNPTEETKATEPTEPTKSTEPSEPAVSAPEPFNGETTTVQSGEGLWQVAQRVCGDGEKYNVLAEANGLSVWEGLRDGMTLKVVCNK